MAFFPSKSYFLRFFSKFAFFLKSPMEWWAPVHGTQKSLTKIFIETTPPNPIFMIKKSSKKSTKNVETKKCWWKIFGKVNEKWKFWKFIFFRKSFKFSKCSFFIDFSNDLFRRKKMVSEKYFTIFSTIVLIFFLRWIVFRSKCFGSPTPIPNFPKIPKITLRTACGYFKNTKTLPGDKYLKKKHFFPKITISWILVLSPYLKQWAAMNDVTS